MTNFKSMAGGAAWMLVSALLAGAALEPVPVAQAAAASTACAGAAASPAPSCAAA